MCGYHYKEAKENLAKFLKMEAGEKLRRDLAEQRRREQFKVIPDLDLEDHFHVGNIMKMRQQAYRGDRMAMAAGCIYRRAARQLQENMLREVQYGERGLNI